MLLISIAESLNDLDATKARLLGNPRDIANVFKTYYGNTILRLTTNEVTARLRKDYQADIKAYDLVQKEILEMSQFFVDGIVKQFPDLF